MAEWNLSEWPSRRGCILVRYICWKWKTIRKFLFHPFVLDLTLFRYPHARCNRQAIILCCFGCFGLYEMAKALNNASWTTPLQLVQGSHWAVSSLLLVTNLVTLSLSRRGSRLKRSTESDRLQDTSMMVIETLSTDRRFDIKTWGRVYSASVTLRLIDCKTQAAAFMEGHRLVATLLCPLLWSPKPQWSASGKYRTFDLVLTQQRGILNNKFEHQYNKAT